jgi:ubiquitin carboxyl-terminal hydrolase 34
LEEKKEHHKSGAEAESQADEENQEPV